MALLFLATALAMILCSPEQLIYDEQFYHHYASDLLEKGLTADYIRELKASPGPLYGLVHAPLFGITNGHPLVMRLTTLCLLILNCWLLLQIAKRHCTDWTPYATTLLLGIPFIGICYTLALTEVPAMCCISACFLLLGQLSSDPDRTPKAAYYGLAAAGLLMGLAAWGRQNYIALLPLAVLYLALQKRSWLELVTFTLPPLLMVTWIFTLWQGVVPPAERHVSNTESILFGISLYSFVFSFGLAGVIFLFLMPRYLKGSWYALAALTILSAALVACFPELRILPSRFLFERVFGDFIAQHFSLIYGTIITTLALWLCIRSVAHLWMHQQSYWVVFTGLSWFIILLSNMKIMHQFSSRYVIVAAPLMIMHAMLLQSPDRWLHLRIILGFIISMILAWNAYQS